MSKFNIGDREINVKTGERGIIIYVYPPRRGMYLYRVKYDDGHENDEKSTDLRPDVDLTDLFERCKQNIYGHYSEYLKDNTSFKIRSSNNSTISSLKASRTLFRAYQFKPLLKFLNSDNKRLLIADEVGLGKTIEAGHIMLELKARGEFHNALIICPMSLKEKWATELKDKFGLDFINVDKKEQLIQEMEHHNGRVRAVVNYDKIRDESDIIRFIEEKQIKFSIIVCDESHKLRNNSTLVYHGAEKLLVVADSVVFMSATPIMIDVFNLYNQLHLLDSNMYDNPEVFSNNIQLNKPFVRALSRLNSGIELNTIAEELINAEGETSNTINDITTTKGFRVDDYFSEYPIYQKIKSDLTTKEDTPSLRAQIQYNLSEMSPMNVIFSRTRKKDVTQDWTQPERNPSTINVSLSEPERRAYDKCIEDYTDLHSTYDEYGRKFTGTMGLVTVKRQLASSVWASLNRDENLDEGIDSFANKNDAKFDALLDVLHTVFSHGNKKIIVFAIFKKTLKYLRIRLEKEGYRCAIIYGDPSINKNRVLNEFEHDGKIQVLLSSEVGSEGLDMQFCNSLVNYDLPWNPMVVEQRIGRIDRFGQKSPKVNVINIVVAESILETIYFRLLTRIGVFKESIGDIEAILDAEIEQDGKSMTIKDALKNMERDFYSDKLTEQEVERKQAEIEQAIENERLNLKNIEEGLTNALTNDSYFREEINKIVNNNAYVTGQELLEFVRLMIKEHLTTCELVQTNDKDIYEIHLPKSDPKVMRRFLLEFQLHDMDSNLLYTKYLNEIDDRLVLPITFNQERAFNDRTISYVNIYHPIIRSGVLMFDAKNKKCSSTYYFELKSDKLPSQVKRGVYMLAIYKITVSRDVFDKPMVTESLYPILFDINNNAIVEDHDVAESFMGRTSLDGQYGPMGDIKIDDEIIDNLRYDFKDCINEYIEQHRSDIESRIENNRKLRYQQTIQYYFSREENYRKKIEDYEYNREVAIELKYETEQRNAENTIRLLEANLRDLLKKKETDLEKINRDVHLKVTEELKSLNLVKVV